MPEKPFRAGAVPSRPMALPANEVVPLPHGQLTLPIGRQGSGAFDKKSTMNRRTRIAIAKVMVSSRTPIDKATIEPTRSPLRSGVVSGIAFMGAPKAAIGFGISMISRHSGQLIVGPENAPERWMM